MNEKLRSSTFGSLLFQEECWWYITTAVVLTCLILFIRILKKWPLTLRSWLENISTLFSTEALHEKVELSLKERERKVCSASHRRFQGAFLCFDPKKLSPKLFPTLSEREREERKRGILLCRPQHFWGFCDIIIWWNIYSFTITYIHIYIYIFMCDC